MINNNGSQQKSNLRLMLRALKHRNYRLFFAGQGVSVIGTWMQMAAIGWLVYRLTGSEFYLGLVSFCGQIPILLGSLIGGDFADRWPRRKIIIITQILAMFQAFMLALIVATHTVTTTRVILLSIFLGIVNAFDMPTRQAFVVEMVDDKNDLPNAIALNSLIFNIARQIGPMVAGFLIARVGEASCFFINAVSFIAVIWSLIAMRLPRSGEAKHNGAMLAGIKDGLSYSFNFMPIRSILLYTAGMSLVAMPYGILMPVFAKSILHGGPQTYGLLLWSTGIGAFIGALFLARRKSVHGLDTVVVIAAGVFAAGVIGFSFSTNLWLSLLLIAMPGFGLMVQMASVNTIIQSLVDDNMRGRVLSLHVMSFIGISPFGSLLAGISAHYIGTPHTLLISGILTIVIMIIFAKKLPAIRQQMHPIYVRKGIIPEIAAGLSTAAQFSAHTKD
ncbi:MAG: MFS transporter [Phycisphaerae bacterium]|jgi:MFS family permease